MLRSPSTMLVRSGAIRRNLPLRLLLSSRPSPTPTTCQLPISSLSTACCRRALSTRHELRPWRRKTFKALAGFGRNLATALDAALKPPMDTFEADLFKNLPKSTSPDPAVWELKSFNGADPLIVADGTEIVAGQRVNPEGIPGQVDELIAVFDACAQVGKLDRAALALQRLQKMNVTAPEFLIELHNSFLLEMASQIRSDPSIEQREDIHKWFELRIKQPGLPYNSETIALMLKASLFSPNVKNRDRFVTRYMSLLPVDTALESLFAEGVLSDEDLSTIADICPAYNFPDGLACSPHTHGDGDVGAGASGGGAEGGGAGSASSVPEFDNSFETPEVRSVFQKGLGLKSLKEMLSIFGEIPKGFDIARLSVSERRELQARLERDSIDAAVNRWREENQSLMDLGLNSQLSTPTFGARLYEWQTALRDRIAEEFVLVEASEQAKTKGRDDIDRCLYGPFLRQSDPSRLAAVTILAVLSNLTSAGVDHGTALTNTVSKVARSVEEDITLQRELKERAVLAKGDRHAGLDARRARRARPGPSMKVQDGIVVVDESADRGFGWPVQIRTRLGAFLLSALFQTAKITVEREHPVTKEIVSQVQPAFSHTTSLSRGKKQGMLQPNKAVVELMTREPRGDILARHLPMVSEPDCWTGFDKGGFLESHSTILRIKHGEKDQEHYARAAIARGDMDQVMRGLDVLGRTAWNINKPVFHVMLEAWNTGEAIANFPPSEPSIDIAPEPDASDDPMSRRLWLRQVKAAEQEKQGLHSNRCYINFQMEIARAFLHQTFYFPHNVDFRGRAYPMPTYLNHMGADHTRGLLRFAKGKPLGENGLRWLKIHLSNVFGFDKASLLDREAFAVDHLDEIFDSVTKPLTGKKWWLKGEDPWQVLGACFELKAALESPDPTKFVSHLPVHQDGTCNGLQHYAALGGDSWGAQQVNLIPGEKPSDIYSAVAELLEKMIAEDVKNDDPNAKLVAGKITRKVVKQTVMTNVYGVTFVGAKKQVSKQLASLYPELAKLDGLEFGNLSGYVASNIFKAMTSMFHGAHEIQEWFILIGDRVCRAVTPEQIEALTREEEPKPKKPKKPELFASEQFHSTLVWTTPLRMPVVQPYRKNLSRNIDTCLAGMSVLVPGRFDPVNRAKQLQAFPPNFIHSLDASHMILSALGCDAVGLTFAAVHDSFWTHASDVEVMSDILRDSFIRIHTDNITGRLLEEFKARYRDSIYLESIGKKTQAAKAIRAHRKKARLNLKFELIQEYERQKLLRSLDPEEVKKGKEMVTPATIFASYQASSDEIAPIDVEGIDDEDIEGSTEPVETDEDGGGAFDEEGRRATNKFSSKGIAMQVEDVISNRVGADDEEDSFFEAHATKLSQPARKEAYDRIWLPLKFPDVPKKGDFDVQQLKTSKYFFS